MSKLLQGALETHPRPAQQPASGLFFLCSFLLLIAIPASGYVEIWAKACLGGGSPGVKLSEIGCMSMQRPNYYVPRVDLPTSFPRSPVVTGKEITGESAMP
jgi:hypothetical protein